MRPTTSFAAVLLAFHASVASGFDPGDLRGTWGESKLSQYACSPSSRRQKFELSADAKTLTVTLFSKAGSRRSEELVFDVLRTDEHSIYFRFPGQHVPPDPLSGEWAISMLGPGVYRWHMTSAHESLQPAPIGVRCEP